MIKIVSVLSLLTFFAAQVGAFTPVESSLMYRCQQAALAMGGYDEYYVNVTISEAQVSDEDMADFQDFKANFLKVKSERTKNGKIYLTARTANFSLWSDVAVALEEFLEIDGFYGSCYLDL